MAATGAINFRDTHFETRDLSVAHGEPVADNVITWRRQLTANASQVPCNLGGGRFGYAGLVFTAQEYARISDVPFVRPVHPAALVVPPTATQHQSNTLRDAYQEASSLCFP